MSSAKSEEMIVKKIYSRWAFVLLLFCGSLLCEACSSSKQPQSEIPDPLVERLRHLAVSDPVKDAEEPLGAATVGLLVS